MSIDTFIPSCMCMFFGTNACEVPVVRRYLYAHPPGIVVAALGGHSSWVVHGWAGFKRSPCKEGELHIPALSLRPRNENVSIAVFREHKGAI